MGVSSISCSIFTRTCWTLIARAIRVAASLADAHAFSIAANVELDHCFPLPGSLATVGFFFLGIDNLHRLLSALSP